MTARPQRSYRPSAQRNEHTYARLTPNLAFQLMGPQTWAAALVPVLVSYVYSAVTYSGQLNILYALVLLAICLLMQSAVNVFNDYEDFRKGTDSKENSSTDAFDAVLVYNDVNPHSVFAFGIALMVFAAALGIYLVIMIGWPLLGIGLIGAAAIVLYSSGRTPISYLPIGEFISGIVMGGLIPLACCYTLSGILAPQVLLVDLPCMIGIGMVLFTNNTCDIEKDIPAKRHTSSVVLGRSRAVRVYRRMILVWIIVLIALVGIFYSTGMPFMLLMLLSAFGTIRALVTNPLNQKTRDGAMAAIAMLNVEFGAFYCLAIAAGDLLTWI